MPPIGRAPFRYKRDSGLYLTEEEAQATVGWCERMESRIKALEETSQLFAAGRDPLMKRFDSIETKGKALLTSHWRVSLEQERMKDTVVQQSQAADNLVQKVASIASHHQELERKLSTLQEYIVTKSSQEVLLANACSKRFAESCRTTGYSPEATIQDLQNDKVLDEGDEATDLTVGNKMKAMVAKVAGKAAPARATTSPGGLLPLAPHKAKWPQFEADLAMEPTFLQLVEAFAQRGARLHIPAEVCAVLPPKHVRPLLAHMKLLKFAGGPGTQDIGPLLLQFEELSEPQRRRLYRPTNLVDLPDSTPTSMATATPPSSHLATPLPAPPLEKRMSEMMA